MNRLTRLWRRTLECVGHWIIDEEQLHPTRGNVLDTSATLTREEARIHAPRRITGRRHSPGGRTRGACRGARYLLGTRRCKHRGSGYF